MVNVRGRGCLGSLATAMESVEVIEEWETLMDQSCEMKSSKLVSTIKCNVLNTMRHRVAHEWATWEEFGYEKWRK